MLMYTSIDPVAFHIGSWPVYWYGLMYLVGFFGGWALLAIRLRKNNRGFTQDQLSDTVFFTALGAVVGGRLGYMLFYDWATFINNPLLLFQTWKGGMSFHGGALGVVIALIWCAKKQKKPVLALIDLVTPAVPLGLGAGRIGNYINGELWGRVTDVPWGMIFPTGGSLPRHPSQLYECALEGILLFIILWTFSRKSRPLGAVSGMFAIFYGLFRFIVEFYREPDVQIGYVAFGWMTKGQLLSIPLIIAGIGLMVYAYRKKVIYPYNESVSY